MRISAHFYLVKNSTGALVFAKIFETFACLLSQQLWGHYVDIVVPVHKVNDYIDGQFKFQKIRSKLWK